MRKLTGTNYGDNRDIVWKIKDNKKYRPYIKSSVKAFMKDNPPPLKILDMGAREGYGTKLFKKYGYEVVGTDIVAGYVKFAQKRGRNVIFDDITDSKFSSNTFDAIFARHSFHYCRSAKMVLDTFRRILKPKGFICVIIPIQSKKTFLKAEHPGLVSMQYYESVNIFKNTLENNGFFCKWIGPTKKYGINPQQKEILTIAYL